MYVFRGCSVSSFSLAISSFMDFPCLHVYSDIHTTASPTVRFLVRASYLQIYNEVISDLLKPERTNLSIREDKKRGVFVEGLSEWVVRSPAEIYGTRELPIFACSVFT